VEAPKSLISVALSRGAAQWLELLPLPFHVLLAVQNRGSIHGCMLDDSAAPTVLSNSGGRARAAMTMKPVIRSPSSESSSSLIGGLGPLSVAAKFITGR
jgi:hypothetical protein